MKRVTQLLLLPVLLAFAASANAQEADPIRQNLEKARQAKESKIDAAREKLIAAIDAKIAEIAKKGNLPDLKRVKAVKEAFLAEGKPPTDALVALASRDFVDTIKSAETDFRKALETAKTDYTKAQNIEAAEIIDEELKQTAPKVVKSKPKEKPKPDPINGQWRISIGERKFESDKVKSLNLRIDPGGTGSTAGFLWRKQGGDSYTLIFPNGATAKVKLGPKGEQFHGKMTTGAPIHGLRKI